MAKSFMLIDVDEDAKETVRDEIRDHHATCKLYTVVDDGNEESINYDIIVEIKSDTKKGLNDAEAEIRSIKRIRSTLTLEVIEGKEDRRKYKPLQI
jgi:pyruvate-formate lyase